MILVTGRIIRLVLVTLGGEAIRKVLLKMAKGTNRKGSDSSDDVDREDDLQSSEDNEREMKKSER